MDMHGRPSFLTSYAVALPVFLFFTHVPIHHPFTLLVCLLHSSSPNSFWPLLHDSWLNGPRHTSSLSRHSPFICLRSPLTLFRLDFVFLLDYFLPTVVPFAGGMRLSGGGHFPDAIHSHRMNVRSIYIMHVTASMDGSNMFLQHTHPLFGTLPNCFR
jgi:hypothetical protein